MLTKAMVYFAELIALLISPGSTASASTVSFVATLIGPEYTAEDVVGIVPSVV
jgi:hypothetical protein